MITLLKLKKGWLFVKEYWWAFVALALLGVGFLLGMRNSKGVRTVTELLNNKREQIEKERKLVGEAAKREEEIKATAVVATKKLEADLADRDEALTKEMKEKVKVMAREAAGNPEKFGEDFASEFGLDWENNND